MRRGKLPSQGFQSPRMTLFFWGSGIWDRYEAVLPTETNSYVKRVFNDTQPCEYEDSLLPSIGTQKLND